MERHANIEWEHKWRKIGGLSSASFTSRMMAYPCGRSGFGRKENSTSGTGTSIITTRAMVGHPKWPAGLVYVDLFAGSGICKLRGSSRRIPGSTLIAANAPKPFRMILAIELDPKLAAALDARLITTPSAAVAKVFEGDCNTKIDELIQHIPERALTLGFIDPESLNVDFETVKKLSDCGQVDLLILFADKMDLVRNVDRYEKETPSVLDKMMGPNSQWRELWTQLSNRSADNICRLFIFAGCS